MDSSRPVVPPGRSLGPGHHIHHPWQPAVVLLPVLRTAGTAAAAVLGPSSCARLQLPAHGFDLRHEAHTTHKRTAVNMWTETETISGYTEHLYNPVSTNRHCVWTPEMNDCG